ncbi:hypothetical protein C9374_004461 [Naegleria lovaniensis]|uniref:G8 domain-containing protein n=1 Tax=Naegleria lovaniensis TaxID=51637 RepID=A0AA88GQ62_NAELO|nr:uncharacterized protein C9374_004461 [Naegleria lovaniensis]KAG2383124.1 hypothetical protein C9374_004461 [Naegleria lovaniensis]
MRRPTAVELASLFLLLLVLTLITTPFVHTQSCPHTAAGLINFSTLSGWNVAGSDIVISSGQNVLVDQTSSAVLRSIVVQNNAKLIFSDLNLNLNIEYIRVDNGGSFIMGDETCPLQNKIVVTFYGARTTSNVIGSDPADNTETGYKGMVFMTGSSVKIHGRVYTPTWTVLQSTAQKGTTTITVNQSTQWKVGDKLVIANTDFSDLYHWNDNVPDSLKWKQGFRFLDQNEVRTIVQVVNSQTFVLNAPLNYTHFAEGDIRAEVGVLNRNIIFQGDASSESSQFGGHIMFRPGLVMQIRGVEITKMGNAGILGRYPMHFHVFGEHAFKMGSANFYLKDSSIHDTYQRCVVVHDTNGVTIEGNICWNTKGHQYFLEDGVEMGNTFKRNLGINPIPVASEDSYQLIKSDSEPAVFWITNPNNTWIQNAAVGGKWSYWFTMPKDATGVSSAKYGKDNYYIRPRNQPLGLFSDNVGHSCGRNSLHIDDMVKPDTTTEMASYVPVQGPYEYPAGVWYPAVYVNALFSNYISYKNRGYGVWSRSGHLKFSNMRLYDNMNGMNAPPSGPVLVENSLIVGETNNVGEIFSTRSSVDVGGRSRPGLWEAKEVIKGFEHYDNGGPQIVSNVTFRNFQTNSYRPAGALSGLSFGPFKHQTRNRLIDLKFENANVYYQLPSFYDNHKGSAIADIDGSSTGYKAGGWIVSNDSLVSFGACEGQTSWNGYKCPAFPESYGQLIVNNNVFTTSSNQGANGVNYPDLSDPSKRVPRMKVIDLTRNKDSEVIGAVLSSSSSLSLYSNVIMRNFYTLRWSFNTPTPSDLSIELNSNAHSDWIILSIQYPTTATLQVNSLTWGTNSKPLTAGSSIQQVMDSYDGSVYYYDSNTQHLYIKLINRAGNNAYEEYYGFVDYSYDGRSIRIIATCPNNACAPSKFDLPTDAPNMLKRYSRDERYAGVLQTCQQNPTVNSPGNGYVFAMVNTLTRTIDFSVYHDLTKIATKIEVGIGQPGNEQRILQRDFKISPYSISRFTYSYSYDEYTSLVKGEMFVKLSTSINPNGHLRAQLYCNNGKKNNAPTCSLPPSIPKAQPCDVVNDSISIFSESSDITGWPHWAMFNWTSNVDTKPTYFNYQYSASPICGKTSLLFGSQRGGLQIYKFSAAQSPFPSVDTSVYKYFEFYARALSGGPLSLSVSFSENKNSQTTQIGQTSTSTTQQVQHFVIDDTRATRVRIPLASLGIQGTFNLQVITFGIDQDWATAKFREVILDNLRFVKDANDESVSSGLTSANIAYFGPVCSGQTTLANPDADPMSVTTTIIPEVPPASSSTKNGPPRTSVNQATTTMFRLDFAMIVVLMLVSVIMHLIQ